MPLFSRSKGPQDFVNNLKGALLQLEKNEKRYEKVCDLNYYFLFLSKFNSLGC
jgi:hypothetical protein